MKTKTSKQEWRYLGNLLTSISTTTNSEGKVISVQNNAYIIKSDGTWKPIFKEARVKAIEDLSKAKCDRVRTQTLVRCEETNELLSEEKTDTKDEFNKSIAQAILSAHPKAKLINGYEKFNN